MVAWTLLQEKVDGMREASRRWRRGAALLKVGHHYTRTGRDRREPGCCRRRSVLVRGGAAAAAEGKCRAESVLSGVRPLET